MLIVVWSEGKSIYPTLSPAPQLRPPAWSDSRPIGTASERQPAHAPVLRLEEHEREGVGRQGAQQLEPVAPVRRVEAEAPRNDYLRLRQHARMAVNRDGTERRDCLRHGSGSPRSVSSASSASTSGENIVRARR